MKKNILVFTAMQNAPDNLEYLSLCLESWKTWARRVGNVEILLLENPVYPVGQMKPTWQRWFVFDIIDNSDLEFEIDQIALVDLDTLIHPQAPNFFLETGQKEGIAGVRDDLMVEWIHNSIKGYKKFFPEVSLDWTNYFNCGFVVLKNKEIYRQLCKKITSFYLENAGELRELQHKTLRKGSDQTPVNYWVERIGIGKQFLSPKWNFTHIDKRGILMDESLFFETAYVYHFNGFEKTLRKPLMEKCWAILNEKSK